MSLTRRALDRNDSARYWYRLPRLLTEQSYLASRAERPAGLRGGQRRDIEHLGLNTATGTLNDYPQGGEASPSALAAHCPGDRLAIA